MNWWMRKICRLYRYAYIVECFLTILFVSNLNVVEPRNISTGLEKLIDQIFTIDDYNSLVRPTDKLSGLTTVNTELKLLQIDLDEKYQELVSTVWVEMSWEDYRLSWNASDYDGVTEITLPVSKLWIPDIVLQNGVGRNEYLNEMKYFNPWISHTGVITWVPEIRLHTRCFIKVSDFPFDTQCCEINFYSWAHTVKQMKIQQYGNKNVTNTTHLSYNTEWHVYHTCALNKIIVTSEELHWWVTSYVIYIKRHTAYHIYTLLMPCFVLSMLSMLLFLLPPDSGEKVTLGVTILLAFFVNSLVVSNYTPEATSDLPVIGVYYVFNIGLVSVSVGTAVCVLNFHFRGHKVSAVPLWLRKVLLIKNAQKQHQLDQEKINELLANTNSTSQMNNLAKYHTRVIQLPDEQLDRRNFIYLNETKFYSKKNNKHMSTSTCGKYNIKAIDIINDDDSDNERIHYTFPKTFKSDVSDQNNNNNNLTRSDKDTGTKDNIEKILKLLKRSTRLLEKTRLKDKNIHIIYDDWKEVASRIDLILFIIASTVVICTPIGLFGKFLIRDETFKSHNITCGCSK